MSANNIIVREYLESLKEDKELDYLFPILLSIMGFRLVATAKEAKGQPQYGKDIVAIKKEGENYIRYYFELKGYDAKDITDANYSVRDGVRESIIEAKDAAFSDKSIPHFDSMPIIIVFVHNGIIKPNIRPTFDGFIQREFPTGNFERWDIFKLTDLFTQYLFNEYLFTDEESLRLFKRSIILLDAPDNSYIDFIQLIEHQLEKLKNVQGRALKKLFATFNLLSVLIIHYAKENNNLTPAKECLTFLILRVWAWILHKQLDTKEPILREYRKLLKIHFDLLHEYLLKITPTLYEENGMFSVKGAAFEVIGYPLRSFDTLNLLCYYLSARYYWPNFTSPPSQVKEARISKYLIPKLIQYIESNEACTRPLLDNHSIAVLNVFLSVLRSDREVSHEDLGALETFISKLFDNIFIIKLTRGRLPEIYNNVEAITEYVSTDERPYNYQDGSSLLLTLLFELTAVLHNWGIDLSKLYTNFRELTLESKVNLQTAFPLNFDEQFEEELFLKKMHNKYYVECSISLPESLDGLVEKLKKKPKESYTFRTQKAGFPFLLTLASIYFKNERFPSMWRNLIN